jgi:hypothetical protein
LDGAGYLAHPLVSCRQAEQPDRERDAVDDGRGATEEREQDGVIPEETQLDSPLPNEAPVFGAAVF